VNCADAVHGSQDLACPVFFRHHLASLNRWGVSVNPQCRAPV
jgi:hypothetical protein